MRLLWIATKPPLPPVDGGRLVQKLTLEALAAAGAEITLVAPVVDGPVAARDGETTRALAAFCTPHLVPVEEGRVRSTLRTALPGGPPLTLARHDRPEVRHRAAELLAGPVPPYDLVHVEQLHALPHAEAAFMSGLPVVLRAQNVESDLWSGAAGLLPWPLSLALRLEGTRLARYEAAAVRRAAGTVALTPEDGAALERLAATGAGTATPRVDVVPAPFPPELPRGDTPLAGDPPVVVLGSAGWLPNRDAWEWMRDEVWPEVRRRAPRAVLHLFGPGQREEDLREGVMGHPPPADSATAFAHTSLLAVPLRLASGVRMKILEAWARGVPVIATPQAARGLGAVDGSDLLLASDAAGFATAVARLAGEPQLWRRLVEGGRRALSRHRPQQVARELLAVYRRVTEGGEDVDSAAPP